MANNFSIYEYIDFLEKCIYRSMIMEVGVTPKPGLVDLDNTGSHKDMNFSVFRASAQALRKYFREFMEVSVTIKDKSKILTSLRDIGKQAEEAMYFATNQINTHKGMIFNIGLISSVCTFLAKEKERELTLDDIDVIRYLIKVNSMPLDLELSNVNTITNGIVQYQEYGVGGARGEALSGYFTVFEIGLPYFLKIKDKAIDLNTKLIAVLLKLITETEDSNLVKRGGISGMKFMKDESNRILELIDDEDKFILETSKFDKEAIKRNLSPGGSADLLAAVIFCLLMFRLID